MKIYIFALQLGLLLAACTQDNKFTGGAGTASTDEGAGAVDEASSGGAPSAEPEAGFDAVSSGPGVDTCTEGDKIVVPWTGPAKDCIDQGKTYLFDTKTCADIRKATFSCDWATLQEKLREKALLSETLKNEAASGAKLISCGQSADGDRIAVQWVKLTANPTLSCAKVQQGGGITTGCYTHYPDGNVPPPAANVEERRQRVFACLKQL